MIFSRKPQLLSTIKAAARRLSRADVAYGHGTDNAFDEAAFIVLESMNLPPDTDIAAQKKMPLSPEQKKKIDDVVKRRIETRKPAPYLLNRAYMHGVSFYVDERVIVPRSFIGDLLCAEEGFYLSVNPQTVLDLCTGSGCLAILAALVFGEAQVDAVDLSPEALEVARRNVADHGLEGRVSLYQGDLFAPLAGKKYDLIITNPPYVDAPGMDELPPEYQHEPSMALAAGHEGLDIVLRILEQAPRYLTPQGGMICEIGRCRPALEAARPDLPFLWLDTPTSSGEVFWLRARDFSV